MAGVIQRDGQASRFDEDLFDTGPLRLELTVADAETAAEIRASGDQRSREDFALQALKIGVLALRQARGQLDAELIQRETERLLSGMDRQLAQHAHLVQERLAGALKEYFDPDSGRFSERVKRLVEKDGDLERVLRSQIGGEDSELCKTLTSHFGEQSPLMKLLRPDESQGLLAALRDTVGEQLKVQRDRVLAEFSLDNKDGALARLIHELSEDHGQLSEKLQEKIDEVVKEFSLDEENSALSRLVKNVERAQQTISREFSLDDEASAFSRLKVMLEGASQAIHSNLTLDDETSSLARLKREVVTILSAHCETNTKFQQEVRETLSRMITRKEEAARSTTHGKLFQDAVGEFLQRQAQNRGDEFIATGNRTGLIRNCKVGDFVIELGPECAAAGARVAIEAKEEQGYSFSDGRKEIERARENRQAQIGLFVFSHATAPAGMDRFARCGSDVFVVWDAEDAATDVYLLAGLETARALCVRAGKQTQAQAADFCMIDAAILEIEKRTSALGDITTWTETIQSNSKKILDHIAKARTALEKQVDTLRDTITELKNSMAEVDL